MKIEVKIVVENDIDLAEDEELCKISIEEIYEIAKESWIDFLNNCPGTKPEELKSVEIISIE